MTRYYTLVSSLPHLAHFERAERVAINRSRLDQRLTMLREDHARELGAAEALIMWHRQPRARTTAQIVEQYRRTLATVANDSMRAFVAFRMDMRTAIAALRLRHRGEPAPASPAELGVGPRCALILANWDAEDLGVRGIYPWIVEARAHVEGSRPVDMERLVMEVAWHRLTRIGDLDPFGFEGVFSYVFKWDITNSWLSHDAEAATVRFKELVTEAISEQQSLNA